MDDPERLLPLTGAFNFRDLGGYPADGGQVTKPGQLFRSDGLHRLTDADVGLLRSIGLRTIIDLRTPGEVEHTGRGLLGNEAIAYHHLAVVQRSQGEAVGAPAPAGDDLAERYLWYLDTGREALVTALGLVASKSNHPLVFHCTAGKDRTGVLAALVLDILGVERETIVADYVITADRLELIVDRIRNDPTYSAGMAKVPASRFTVEAATMERFLEGLQAGFGGARAWAVGAGVAPDALDRMRSDLLEPAG
ncbi:MAG TPA: tyrosine-protein phosphatase [Acidimicrobiales bacterium]|nr:tyrosine-protein phosphatase [Acidimicrobiales bacterium]